MPQKHHNRLHFLGVAFASLSVIVLSSGDVAASEACPGDTTEIHEDNLLGGIIESLPDESDTAAWKAHFDDSYLDGQKSAFLDAPSCLYGWGAPYSKWMTAAYLVAYGINSTTMPTYEDDASNVEFADRPWHGWFDYARLAKARSTRSHFNYRTRYTTSTKYFGDHTPHTTDYGLWTERDWERVRLFCGVMTTQYGGGHPVVRAGVLVHEGQHSRTYRYQGQKLHIQCPTYDGQGKPTGTMVCDRTVSHRRHAYANKAMYNSNERAFQAQYEFQCDLASFGRAWVLQDYRAAAQSIAEYTRINQLTGTDLPACGNPFPFGRKGPEKPNCVVGAVCGCAQGMTNCGGTCVYLNSNNDNCGACGAVCDGTCADSVCQQCPWGACSVDADCSSAGACLPTGCCGAPPPA